MKEENAIIRKYLGDRIHSFRVELSISRESVAKKLCFAVEESGVGFVDSRKKKHA